ncbi:hypothetical protein [Endozoicomonas elysicola]|uniref:Uncharacterized protein n=1 Tax=Endozoicomonas elysicola TaxID=305900 RepID=A0A081KFI8_9GAMM|nr:hypothetical protein [Endozoicomonas elysicola]KEI72914.1 hypothetical protein GV64_21260 [Endozoicomonas elysicola]
MMRQVPIDEPPHEANLEYLELNSHISIDGRQYQKKSLSEYNIRVVHGVTSGVFFKGNFNTLMHFQTPHTIKCVKNTPQGIITTYYQPSIVKFEEPKNIEEYKVGSPSCVSYPLTKTGHLQITIRNILSWHCAKALKIDRHFPECGIAITDEKPGLFMRRINGQTVHTWLIEQGYFDKSATALGISNQLLEKLKHMQNAYTDSRFQNIMHNSLNLAFTEFQQLELQWRNIRFNDYITGQGDRGTLTNLMISFDKEGIPLIEALDNDMTFPVSNTHLQDHLKKPPIPPSTFEVEFESFYNNLIPMVQELLPEALEALTERLECFRNLFWFYAPPLGSPKHSESITPPEFVSQTLPPPGQTNLSIRQRICKAANNLADATLKCACFRRGDAP